MGVKAVSDRGDRTVIDQNRESSIVTLHIVEIRGRSMWWTWVIRDSAGVLVEESRTQFRSAAAAESEGRARIADLKNRHAR